jgi:hypothetical protein
LLTLAAHYLFLVFVGMAVACGNLFQGASFMVPFRVASHVRSLIGPKEKLIDPGTDRPSSKAILERRLMDSAVATATKSN